MRLRRKRGAGPAVTPVGGAGAFADITQYVIKTDVLGRTLELIRAAAAEFDELFVAWGGTVDGAVATVTDLFVPRQRCIHTEDGMFVHIEGRALFELNRTFHEAGLLLIGQAHAHPTTAFHSRADDELAFATAAGAISLVIPDWARDRAPTRHWRWFRLGEDERWHRLPESAITVA
jgi:hypothetical protein